MHQNWFEDVSELLRGTSSTGLIYEGVKPARLNSPVRKLKSKLGGSRLQVALSPLLHAVLQHVPHHNDGHIRPRQLVPCEPGGHIDGSNSKAHGQASNSHAHQVCQQEALRQQLWPQYHSCPGIVLQALDAIGVLLIATWVIWNQDALLVASPLALILQLLQSVMEIWCR